MKEKGKRIKRKEEGGEEGKEGGRGKVLAQWLSLCPLWFRAHFIVQFHQCTFSFSYNFIPKNVLNFQLFLILIFTNEDIGFFRFFHILVFKSMELTTLISKEISRIPLTNCCCCFFLHICKTFIQ